MVHISQHQQIWKVLTVEWTIGCISVMNQQMCLLLLVHITGAPNKRKTKEKSWEHLYEDWTVNLLTIGPIFCKHMIMMPQYEILGGI